jgi:hypothetical protein
LQLFLEHFGLKYVLTAHPEILKQFAVVLCDFAFMPEVVSHVNFGQVFFGQEVFSELLAVGKTLERRVHIASISEILQPH